LKKLTFLLALSLLLAGVLAVNSTLALPDIQQIFSNLTAWLRELGTPDRGGSAVRVSLVNDPADTPLSPGSAASSETAVRNDGADSVYFRLAYAVQYDAETWDQLTIDFDDHFDAFAETSGWQEMFIGSTPFRLKVFTYKHTLASGETSPEITLTVRMDADFTSEQFARYRSDFLQIQALAIETDAFADEFDGAQAALDAAIPIENIEKAFN